MAEANDQQMQKYCDERIRVFAEQFRAVLAGARDHKAAVDAVYERAAGACGRGRSGRAAASCESERGARK